MSRSAGGGGATGAESQLSDIEADPCESINRSVIGQDYDLRDEEDAPLLEGTVEDTIYGRGMI